MDKLSKEELELLKARREEKERMQACDQEIRAVLERYNAGLAVDPNSPISQPVITLILNR